MVTTKEMIDSCGHYARIKIKGKVTIESFVENYIYEEGEDKEPMILYSPSQAAWQSDIEKKEIL